MEKHGREEGRARLIKTLVPSSALKEHTGCLLKKLVFQKVVMLQQKLTISFNNKDMTLDKI